MRRFSSINCKAKNSTLVRDRCIRNIPTFSPELVHWTSIFILALDTRGILTIYIFHPTCPQKYTCVSSRHHTQRWIDRSVKLTLENIALVRMRLDLCWTYLKCSTCGRISRGRQGHGNGDGYGDGYGPVQAGTYDLLKRNDGTRMGLMQ